LPNSDIETDGATVGLSWVSDRGFVGVAFRNLDSLYGIPAELEDASPAPGLGVATVEGVRIDMDQQRIDLRSGFDTEFGPFNGVRFSFGTTDYEHVELAGGEVGTRFLNNSDEARLELTHGETGPISGVVGLQYVRLDLAAIGDEAVSPPSGTDVAAVFAFEQIKSGSMRYEVGLRFETTEVRSKTTVAANPVCLDPRDRDFDAISGSAGAAWVPNETYTLSGSVSRAVRPPNAEELYSCGEHVATLSVEIGDPTLDEEINLGVDLGLRKRRGRVTGQLNLFNYDYDDYMYEFDTGLTNGSFPIFRFVQADASFYGAELSGLIELFHADDHDLDLEFVADNIRSELDASGETLPRMPPLSAGLSLVYRGTRWYADAGFRVFDDVDRIAPSETPTRGYTLLSARVGYKFAHAGVVHDLMLRGNNLGDEEARTHTSRLKDLVPLPGRGIGVVYRLVF